MSLPASTILHPISVAPMMQRTDRHFRFMMRAISGYTLLWTEMVTARAILNGDREHLLGYDASEHPLVLQTGGDDPEELARVARFAQQWGYDEINLNVGCPSERVKSGNFGACLMLDPERVAACAEAMTQACTIPVTVKHRIGVDDHDTFEHMLHFVEIVAKTGACQRFTVHARKAWLKGLSPKENRNIPPLRYEEVYRLKSIHPELQVEINGGVKTIDEVEAHLQHVDAVMLGRAAYDTPFMFHDVDQRIYGATTAPVTREQVVAAMLPYIEERLSSDPFCKLHHITRHITSLYAGQRGARIWRRYISENHIQKGAGPEVLEEALRRVQDAWKPQPEDA
jgi:tRNA-dihydrouridine synthase A